MPPGPDRNPRVSANDTTSRSTLDRVTEAWAHGPHPLRILQLVQKPQRRGAEIFAFQLSAALRRLGQEVRTAYLYPFDGPGRLEVRDDDLVLGRNEHHFTEKLPGSNPSLLKNLLRTIDTFSPHIVQLNGARSVKYGAIARHLRRNDGWRVVYRNIGNPSDWAPRGAKRVIFRAMTSAIDGVVALDAGGLQLLWPLYPRTARFSVIPNGVDPETLVDSGDRDAIRLSMGVPTGTAVILSVGSLAPEKRVDLLIDGFEQLRGRGMDARLWIVGDGPLRGDLEAAVTAKGLTAEVAFTGVRSDVAALMSAADLLALTSDTEGMPAVVLEAGYMGLPVVATRVGALADCVRDGETGILIEPNDSREVATALAALVGEPGRRKTMAEAARRHVRRYFTMDVIAAQYLDFYFSLHPNYLRVDGKASVD